MITGISSVENKISAILLAAGTSSRMGQPKMLLPWGSTTVLGQVISTFAAAGVEDIVVVTGGARQQVEKMVSGLANKVPVRTAFNPEYAHTEMLGSIQVGLEALCPGTRAALIGLGDQPQVLEETIRQISTAYVRSGSLLVMPSYQNHRGHPWLVARTLWAEITALSSTTTPRQFLNLYAGQMEYIEADRSILEDLDTPADYSRQRP